ncbi:MAG TPA: lipoyl synthase [bacterium]|nr:lipoyl synthase [bacterium]
MERIDVQAGGTPARRLPTWMRREKRDTEQVLRLKKILREKHLHTVCQSAGCPNISECFSKPTATFMILGNVCTRHCGFCGISKGVPEPVDIQEPEHIAEVTASLKLKHVVITSVTRDDLTDGGAGQFAATVRAVRDRCPETSVEVLIPDFLGRSELLEIVLQSGVDILNHNLETIPRLYPQIRPEADYRRSLQVLARSKKIRPGIISKSGLMLGLGENLNELVRVFGDLANAGCDVLTLGQYLAPSQTSVPVVEYIHPEAFQTAASRARALGIRWVHAGPFVRSSYNADEIIGRIKETSGG